jgi:hypothetical protein
MPIRALLEGEPGLGPEDITALSVVFEDTLRALGLRDRTDPLVLRVAKLTIEKARHAERDPARLRAAVLEALLKALSP